MKRVVLITVLLLFVTTPIHAQFFGPTRSIANGTSDPSTCQPSGQNVFINRNSTPVLKICTSTDVWATAGGGTIGGSTGATDLTVLVANGTGGSTIAPGTGVRVSTGNVLIGSAAYLQIGINEIGFSDGVGPFFEDSNIPARLTLNVQALNSNRTKTLQDVSGTLYETGGVDVAVVDGGTGASTRTGAQSNLGLLTSRVTTQFDKTNATLANVPGLSVPLLAATSYTFHAVLHIDADAVDVSQVALSGTATLGSVIAEVFSIDNLGFTVGNSIRLTAFAAPFQPATTSGAVYFDGTITTVNAGTLTIQFAKASAINGNASSVLVGSVLVAQEVP